MTQSKNITFILCNIIWATSASLTPEILILECGLNSFLKFDVTNFAWFQLLNQCNFRVHNILNLIISVNSDKYRIIEFLMDHCLSIFDYLCLIFILFNFNYFALLFFRLILNPTIIDLFFDLIFFFDFCSRFVLNNII